MSSADGVWAWAQPVVAPLDRLVLVRIADSGPLDVVRPGAVAALAVDCAVTQGEVHHAVARLLRAGRLSVSVAGLVDLAVRA